MDIQYDLKLNELFIRLFRLDILSSGFENDSLFSRKIGLDANDVLLLIFSVYKSFCLPKNCFSDLAYCKAITFNVILEYIKEATANQSSRLT